MKTLSSVIAILIQLSLSINRFNAFLNDAHFCFYDFLVFGTESGGDMLVKWQFWPKVS